MQQLGALVEAHFTYVPDDDWRHCTALPHLWAPKPKGVTGMGGRQRDRIPTRTPTHASFFSRLSFSWPNGLVNLPDYEHRHCSLCDQVHPFDALSCLAQCTHLTYARSLAFDVWPTPIQPTAIDSI